MMTGDGINDSPALSQADVGIGPLYGFDISAVSILFIVLSKKVFKTGAVAGLKIPF